MIHLSFKNVDLTITWRMWFVVVATAAGIYLGGVTSGYFMAQAQYAQRAAQRDKSVAEIKQKVDQLPGQVKQAVQDDSK